MIDSVSQVELRPYADSDLPLTQALEGDPEAMRELGGPRSKAEIADVHGRRVELVRSGGLWMTIVLEAGAPGVGALGIWESEHEGQPVHEVGWMVLPAFHGRGIATEALGLLLQRARSDERYERIHAFPGVSNAASNALCRRHGFTLTGTCEVEFSGHPLRCNHWELDVAEPGWRRRSG